MSGPPDKDNSLATKIINHINSSKLAIKSVIVVKVFLKACFQTFK
jgi:hypothetical protein